MAYVRVKKIKDREYAYLVKNKWLKGKKRPKQSVSRYLGRVYSYSDPKDHSFLSFVKKETVDHYIKDSEKKALVEDLILWEFRKHGVTGVSVDMKKGDVSVKGKSVSLRLNEGHMNSHTLSELIKFRKEKKEEDGFNMAKKFIDAGIKIPEELFIEVFSSKLFK